jgi:hypothetical protein
MLLFETFKANVLAGNGVGSDIQFWPEQLTATEIVGCFPDTMSSLEGSQVQFLRQSLRN